MVADNYRAGLINTNWGGTMIEDWCVLDSMHLWWSKCNVNAMPYICKWATLA